MEMEWRERPVWTQVLLCLSLLTLWFLVVFQEISFLLDVYVAIVAGILLLIVCNRSRRYGVLCGVVIYSIWILTGYISDAKCYASDYTALCGSGVGIGSVYGWLLLPLGGLIGALIGWIIGKIKRM